MRVFILALMLGCFTAVAQERHTVPTNSLSFHLQSLGRTPTIQERELIEAALVLMWRYDCRSDYPLRSIKHDDSKSEWILHFDSGVPDGGFNLYLRDKRATWLEVNFAGTNWRTRFPPLPKKR